MFLGTLGHSNPKYQLFSSSGKIPDLNLFPEFLKLWNEHLTKAHKTKHKNSVTESPKQDAWLSPDDF